MDELELRLIADRDHLTGAMSRRGFVGQLEKEIERFRRTGQQSVFVIMDVDHFKAVNDSHGHPAGDAVLQSISATCAGHLRANDCFGRLGGEEFGILLSGTDEDGARSVGEKLRHAIAEQFIPVAGGIKITASFGLASLSPTTKGTEDWIQDADDALYLAKRAGRNRCVFAGTNTEFAA